jgi:hypothetical protein
MVPIFTFLFIIQAVAESKDELKPLQKPIYAIIILATLTVLAFTAKEAFEKYRDIGIIDSLVSFSIPIAFSIIYLPIAYLFSIFARYEVLFARMSFKGPKDRKIRRKHKKQVFLACGLSHRRIVRFEKDFVGQMYISMGEAKFMDLIHKFKRTVGSDKR